VTCGSAAMSASSRSETAPRSHRAPPVSAQGFDDPAGGVRLSRGAQRARHAVHRARPIVPPGLGYGEHDRAARGWSPIAEEEHGLLPEVRLSSWPRPNDFASASPSRSQWQLPAVQRFDGVAGSLRLERSPGHVPPRTNLVVGGPEPASHFFDGRHHRLVTPTLTGPAPRRRPASTASSPSHSASMSTVSSITNDVRLSPSSPRVNATRDTSKTRTERERRTDTP